MKFIHASPGRTPGFSELIKQHLDSLYSTALQLTKNEFDAEDLVQSTCLKALQNFAQLRDPARGKAWLFRILTNIFIDAYRSKIRQPEWVELDSLDEMCIPWARAEVESLLDHYLSEEIEAALEGLHPDIRLVVWYVDVEEFSYAEVAEMLACSKGTVASRLFRGRNQLKDLLFRHVKNRGMVREKQDEM